ncbi:MAG: exodeoxyribonuclease VII small subunit [Cyanobacteria bacterium]|nr:exodeoxyribonuclease VII small subunit [Cyanobacteria bacterium bin.51]
MPPAKKQAPKNATASSKDPAQAASSQTAESWEDEVKELTYNQSRTALELALSQLQSDELEVETMADLYGRAQAYAERCDQVLARVEQEIMQLNITDLEQDP